MWVLRQIRRYPLSPDNCLFTWCKFVHRCELYFTLIKEFKRKCYHFDLTKTFCCKRRFHKSTGKLKTRTVGFVANVFYWKKLMCGKKYWNCFKLRFRNILMIFNFQGENIYSYNEKKWIQTSIGICSWYYLNMAPTKALYTPMWNKLSYNCSEVDCVHLFHLILCHVVKLCNSASRFQNWLSFFCPISCLRKSWNSQKQIECKSWLK